MIRPPYYIAFRKIWQILTPKQRKGTAGQFALMFIGALLDTIGIGLIVPVIILLTQEDIVSSYPAVVPALEYIGNPDRETLIVIAILALVCIYLIKALYLGFLAWSQTRFIFSIRVSMSQALFTSYMHQPYAFHLQRNSALLVRNVLGEVTLFISNALKPVMQIVTGALLLCGISGLLFLVEPIGTLVVVLVLGGAAWGFHQLTRARITDWGKSRQFHDGRRLQHLQQGLGGAKDVKLLGRESEFLMRFREHNLKGAKVERYQATLHQLPRLWMELLVVICLAVLVLTMIYQNKETASIVPLLGLFAAAAFRLMPAVKAMLSATQTLRYGLPVIDNLHKEFMLASHAPSSGHKGVDTSFTEVIRLKDVSYMYPCAEDHALNSISLDINKGESIGFVGPSGSGKSTLIDVILGLLTPDKGQVLVDGHDIQQDLRAWQDQIGYVPQSIYLTDDTLRRNVAFGLSSEQIDDVAVHRAIKAAQLDDFVASLPGGLDSFVGERGIRISGGQRQRIGIARALYHDPSVLVLDEATSALDTATELDVMKAVKDLQGRKTILIVAHRLSTVEHCNRLYSLHHGQIIEERTGDLDLQNQSRIAGLEKT